MINANLLNNEMKEHFISLIKKYCQKYENKFKSCLVITLSEDDEELKNLLIKIKGVRAFPKKNFFDSQIEFKDKLKYYNFVIQSSLCGLGKSELIKSKIIENIPQKNKQISNYIYFPIGGKFKRKDLVDRLKKLPDMTNLKEKFEIHFDLSQTKEIELLNEFFFKLIILRKCDLNESAKYFGENVDIMIEIPNDFSDYLKDIEILSKLNIKKIESLSNINSSTELLTVVKVLNKCENEQIMKNKKINLTKFNNLKLTEEQKKEKVLKYLNDIQIKDPNFYQINIFIKILFDEFVKFNNCNICSVDSLYKNVLDLGMTKDEAKNFINLRKHIINYLVQMTKLFLVGPNENLLKNKQLNNILNNTKEEDKEEFINTQLNIDINPVSFDKINPSLIIFNEDGKTFTIITTCSENEQEFKDLENLYNIQNIEIFKQKNKAKDSKDASNKSEIELKKEIKKLKSLRNLTREEILNNLFNFMDIKDLNEKQINQILGSYVFTPDNYIKLILILLRIRVNIPVILMGETGCGKTTLIEMGSKLINKGKVLIKKMNVHAGINDKDIIKFMKDVKDKVDAEVKRKIEDKKNEIKKMDEKEKKLYLKNSSIEKKISEYEKQIKSRKIWIFFDEINTCDSLGLFTEIFCKRSIYGQPIDERFIFIAACNPYRSTGNENKNNLLNVLYKQNYKRKNLVYTVNPLPMPLLNFIFNFGSLKEEDEFIYIKSMIETASFKLFKKINDEKNIKRKIRIYKKGSRIG